MKSDPISDLLINPLPVPRNGGFRMKGYWVWDPSAVQARDGKWHFFATRWPDSNPMHPTWLLTSEIVHAVGDRPEGPFDFKEVVLAARGPAYWDGRSLFNPRVQQIEENGKTRYLMTYVGTTHPFADVKSGEPIQCDDPRIIVARSNKRIAAVIADSPDGPWSHAEAPLLLPRPGHFDDFFTSNPAMVFRKDGSVFLMYKTRSYQGANKDFGCSNMMIGAATAPNWRGPYRRLTDEPLFSEKNFGVVEDPFVYEQDSLLHMIAKDMTGKIGGEKLGGIHAVSKDGVKWELGNPVRAWSRNITWDDGSKQVLGSFERPYLLFQNGKATHLLGAVADGPGDFINATTTWDLAVPLKTDDAPAKRSFGDTGIPDLEIGNE